MTKMQKRRTIYTFLLFVFLIIFMISAYKFSKITHDSKSTKNNLIYTNNSNVKYDLILSENNFIRKQDISDYQTHISSIVEAIDMTMSYEYKGSTKLPLEVRKRVVATIYGLYNEKPAEILDKPIMWKKEFIIKDYKIDKYDLTDEFNITENFKLDFNKFNNEVQEFKRYFSLPTLAYLDVSLQVDFGGSNDKYTLREKQIVSAKISLDEQVFDVETIKENSEEKSVLSNDVVVLRKGQRKLAAYVVLTVTSLLLTIITIKLIIINKDQQPFHEEVEAIKKEYDEIVVETKNMLNTKGLNPVTIINFDEMLNLADSLVVPIMLFEEDNKATFYILKGDMIYFYIMKSDNKKKKD